jgi:hypothetical protein
MQTAPERWRLLKAHGFAVGLPTEEDMGNSEVGHNALGAGRIFKQGYVMLVYMIFISVEVWPSNASGCLSLSSSSAGMR